MTRRRATARLRYVATDGRLFQIFHKGEHHMSTDLRFTAEVNQKVIVALSGLNEERLNDCATEIQVGLEIFNDEYRKNIGGPLSPEEFFEAFAAHEKYGLHYSSIDGSSLADLDTPSIYLAAAWSFNDIAEFFLCRWHKGEWSKEEARTFTLSHLKAVDYLIGRALSLRTARTHGLVDYMIGRALSELGARTA
jgi:hypothetical protein